MIYSLWIAFHILDVCYGVPLSGLIARVLVVMVGVCFPTLVSPSMAFLFRRMLLGVFSCAYLAWECIMYYALPALFCVILAHALS